VEHMTNGAPRGGSPRPNPPGDPELQPLTAIAFDTVHKLMHAAHLLKEQRFDVLVAPKRTASCGAVVLIVPESVPAAVAALDADGIAPEEIVDYTLTGGAV